jgi:hypothetical protein
MIVGSFGRAAAKASFRHSSTIYNSSCDMNAAFTSFERHERGIHAFAAGDTATRDTYHQSRHSY